MFILDNFLYCFVLRYEFLSQTPVIIKEENNEFSQTKKNRIGREFLNVMSVSLKFLKDKGSKGIKKAPVVLQLEPNNFTISSIIP